MSKRNGENIVKKTNNKKTAGLKWYNYSLGVSSLTAQVPAYVFFDKRLTVTSVNCVSVMVIKKI